MTAPLRVFALLASLLLSLPALAQAQDPAAAQQFLERNQERAQELLRQRPGTRRDAQLTELLNTMLDYEELSRQALRDHWEARSAEEQQAFVDLLRQLVEKSYTNSLEQTLSFEVSWENAEARRDGVQVESVARSRNDRRAEPVSIDYRLRLVEGQWRVYDIRTDGVSLVRNYRRQFNRIIERDGWDGLLGRMRERLNEDAS